MQFNSGTLSLGGLDSKMYSVVAITYFLKFCLFKKDLHLTIVWGKQEKFWDEEKVIFK